MATPTVISFSFSVKGLCIIYNDGENNVLTLCPCATCDLLQSAGFIEGFDIDGNGEPVILNTDKKNSNKYDFTFFHRFVKTYLFTKRVAEMLLEHKAAYPAYLENMARINRLLNPTKVVDMQASIRHRA